MPVNVVVEQHLSVLARNRRGVHNVHRNGLGKIHLARRGALHGRRNRRVIPTRLIPQ